MVGARREIFVPLDHVTNDQRLDAARQDHERILAAVKDRDPGRAAQEMRRHLISPKKGGN
jgi:DNA-binding GntR family transcriptional regulator